MNRGSPSTAGATPTGGATSSPRPALRRAVLWLWLSVVVCALATGVAQGLRARAALLEAAVEFDARYDPLVLEGGVLRALGPRLPDAPDGSVRFDLDDSGDMSGPVAAERLVFRRTEIIQVRALDRRIYRYADLAEAMGIDTLRIDSDNLQLYLDRWQVWIVAGVAGTWTMFFGSLYLILALLLSAMAAGLNRAFTRGSPEGTSADAWLMHALRAACLLPPAWSALALADIHTGCVTDVAVYTPLLAIGTWLLERDARAG